MKVSTKWLNEYVKVDDLKPEELGEKIERTAVEVDGVSRRADGQKKIVVGHILECVPHPNSDHLHICQVDVGDEEPYQIVCGAPNVAAGQNVIVALPNSWIAGHIKIKKSKMRGELSMGMICGAQGIGLAFAHFAGLTDVLAGIGGAFMMIYSPIKSFVLGCDTHLLPKKSWRIN